MVSVVKRVLEFLLGLMLLAMVGSALMANEEKDTATVEEDMINVPGVVATITVPADTYTITLNVESNNDNGTLASSENKAAMNETVKALIALGVNESSI